MRRWLAVFGVLSFATAFADINDAAKPSDAIPLSVWQLAPSGDATHRQSQLTCPVTVGDFRRVKLTVYDRAGFDVSCGYNGRHGWITLYLTRHGNDTLADDMAEAKRELVQHTPDAKLISDAPSALNSDPSWLTALYLQKDGTMESGIWMAEYSGWMLEFRATYTPSAKAEILAEMTALTTQAEMARSHLTRCAKARPVERGGSAVTDKAIIEKAMMMLSLLGGAGDLAKGQDSKTELAWCADGRVGNAPIILWHAVGEDGADLKADRVTPISLGEPIVLEATPNAITALFSEDKAGNTPEKWYISLKTGKQNWFFAITAGRPSAEFLAATLRDVLDHKIKPIGGFSVDGKTVTISLPPQ